MEFLIPSFLSGILTVLAPCVLSLLPVIIGGSIGEKNKWRPLIIVGSLAISAIIFTLLLKASTVLIGIPQTTWKYISGGLILVFGFFMLFPGVWEKLAFNLKLYKSDELLHKSGQKEGILGAILLGASLGPVFTSCSPTYTIILAIVLPQNFTIGLLNLTLFAVGMSIPLLLIGYGGQKIAGKFRGASNPNGWFKRTLGLLLVLTGLAIFTGYDKKLEAFIIDRGYLGAYDFEQSLLEKSRNAN